MEEYESSGDIVPINNCPSCGKVLTEYRKIVVSSRGAKYSFNSIFECSHEECSRYLCLEGTHWRQIPKGYVPPEPDKRYYDSFGTIPQANDRGRPEKSKFANRWK